MAAELDESGRRVAVEVGTAVLEVAADQGLLRALLGHLMRPSVAASRSGVAFELRVCETGDGRVLIELEDDGGAPSDADARRRLLAFARPDGGGPLLGAGVSGPAARRIVAGHGGVLAFALAIVGSLRSSSFRRRAAHDAACGPRRARRRQRRPA